MSDNRRAHVRIELFAQVEIPREGHIEVLVAHNLSEGGVFLSARADECPWLVPGTTFDLAIALADEGAGPGDDDLLVHAKGRVVHRDRGAAIGIHGVGVVFEQIDDENRRELRAMLVRARRNH